MKKPKPLHELGALQRGVLELLWDAQPATVRDLRAALAAAQGREPAYTTVLSVLQKLEKAGWVAHERQGRTYAYTTTRSRESGDQGALTSLVDGVFGGDPMRLMQHLLEDERIGRAELEELRERIEARRREVRDA